jgi:hypothetical protein
MGGEERFVKAVKFKEDGDFNQSAIVKNTKKTTTLKRVK